MRSGPCYGRSALIAEVCQHDRQGPRETDADLLPTPIAERSDAPAPTEWIALVTINGVRNRQRQRQLEHTHDRPPPPTGPETIFVVPKLPFYPTEA